MKRKLLFFVLMLIPMWVSAYDAQIGGIYYNLNQENNTAMVTYYHNGTINGNAPNSNVYWGAVEIPSEVTYNNVVYSVTGIGFFAFNYCKSLTSIIIPNSVTSIDESAFAYCTSLTTIDIPNSVNRIGSNAFDDTPWYKNQSDGLVYAGKVAYKYKGSMPSKTSITINEGTLGIAGNAFRSCSNLVSISIPNSVMTIVSNAFYECTGLTTFSFPESMTSIDGYVLQYCSGLTSISIPESVTTIGDWTFSGCSSLTSITIPRNVISIGAGVFVSCNHLIRVVTESDTPPVIKENTFPRRAYTTLCVPTGCKAAYEAADYWKEFKVIYDEIVDVVPSYIDFADANVKKICVNKWDTDQDQELSVEEAAAVNGSFGVTFQNQKYITSFDELRYFTNITSLNGLAFYNCPKLTNIALPQSLLSIESNAFSGCIRLTDINIPQKVSSIGYNAFLNCNHLTTVSIPKSVTDLGNRAFEGCNNLTTVIVGWDTPLAISEDVFPNRTNATLYVPAGSKDAYLAANYWKEFKEIVEEEAISDGNIVFADAKVKSICVANWDSDGDGELSEKEAASVTYLGTVFKGSEITSFNELRYFKKLLSIDAYAFRDCSSLASVILPNSIMRIGGRAFSDCTSLSTITIPDGINIMGGSAFYNTAWYNSQPANQVAYIGKIAYAYKGDMPSGTELTLKEGTKVVAPNAFASFYGLKNITLPNSVTSVCEWAFFDCWNMKTVSLGMGVTYIGPHAFSNCGNLTMVNARMSTPVDIANDDVFNSSIFSKATLHVFKGCKSAYQAADVWKNFGTITDDITSFAIHYPFGELSFDIIDDAEKTCEVLGYDLTGEVIIPSSVYGYQVVGFGVDAFEDEEDFESLVVPPTITFAAKNAFKHIGNIIVKISDLEAWCKIDFRDYPGGQLYLNGESLTNLVIPDNITEIKPYAFPYFRNISTVTIPEGVTSVGHFAFYSCDNLTSVTVKRNIPAEIDQYAFSNQANITLYVPVGSKAAYEAADYWKDFKEIVEVSPSNDGSAEAPFTCAEAIAFVTGLMADTPTETEYYVKGKVCKMQYNYSYQYGSATFWISDDGTDNGSFYVYRTLYFDKEQYNGGRVPNIGDEVVLCGQMVNYKGTTPETYVNQCRLVSLNDKTVGTGLEVGDLFVAKTPEDVEMFFVVDNTGKSLGKSTVTGCSVGYAVGNRPETYTNAPACIDSNYEGPITIPETVEGLPVQAVAPSAFAGAKLTAVTMPASIWDIETNAFSGCTNLASVKMPEDVILNNGTFKNCTSLTSVELPKGVQLWAFDVIFSGCTNLTSITVNDETPYELQGNYLVDDPSKVTLYVPVGSKAAYEAIDYWKEFGEIIEKEPEVPVNEIWSGSQEIKEWNYLAIVKEYMESLNIGDVLHVTVTDVAESEANVALLDGSWTGIAPWYGLSPEMTEAVFTLTGDMVRELKRYGMVLSCHGYTIKRIYTTPAYTGSENSIWLGNQTNGDISVGFDHFHIANRKTGIKAGDVIRLSYTGNGTPNLWYIGDDWTWKEFTDATLSTTETGAELTVTGAMATLLNNDKVLIVQLGDAGLTLTQVELISGAHTVVYQVGEGETFASGTQKELENITLTYGETGGADFLTPIAWTCKTEGIEFPYYTPGNNINGNKDGGTFYVFKPQKNGLLTVVVNQNAIKPFYVEENGRVMDQFNGITKGEEGTYQGTYMIEVKANRTYKVYCSGSKLGFYGFIYDWRDNAHLINIEFASEYTKQMCVSVFDTNGDGELSEAEAAAVTDEQFKTLLHGTGEAPESMSFDELQYFTGLTVIPQGRFNGVVYLTSVIIPENVTAIEANAFNRCTKLSSVKLPSGLKSIGAAAFVSVPVTSITIPKQTETIGERAFFNTGLETITFKADDVELGVRCFQNNSNLKSVVLPSKQENLPDYIFRGCTSLENITLPNTLKTLGKEAFRKSGLTSITIPAGVEEIPDSCFKECASLSSVDLTNVTKIDGGAFMSTALTSLVLPESVKELGDEAFACTPINTVDLGKIEKIGIGTFISTAIEELTVPATLSETGYETFSWNFSMTKATFEEGCTKVFDTMFHGNEKLSEVYLPNTIMEIQDRAFQSCTSLTSIILPATVTKIGEQAFNNCTALVNVTAENPTPVAITEEVFSNRTNAILSVPYGCKSAYAAADYWKEFGTIMSYGGSSLYADDLQTLPGTTAVLAVNLDNVDKAIACKFDLRLPAGVTVVTKSNGKLDATLTERAENHSISSSHLDNGDYSFVITSLDNDLFTGNSGALVEIKLDIPSTMECGDYTVQVFNTDLTAFRDNTSTNVKLDDMDSKLTVTYMPGDVNCDGSVSVTDVGCTINYILKKVPEVFVKDAADMDGDNEITVTDVTRIIAFILDDDASMAPRRSGYDPVIPHLSLQQTADGYALTMDNKDAFVGFQFDVELAARATVNSMQLNSNSDHLLTYRRLDNGMYRVVCYSLSNSTFADDEAPLLNMSVTGDVSVSSVLLTTAGLTGLRATVSDDQSTGVASMNQGLQMSVQGRTLQIVADRDVTLRLYTTGGSVYRVLNVHSGVNTFEGLKAGVYMIENRKMIIR